MTKETLTVKNFGPIQEAQLDMRKVTVLIGKQASGKSVLAKLAATFGEILLSNENLDSILDFYGLKEYTQANSEAIFSTSLFSNKYSNNVSKVFTDKYLEEQYKNYVKADSNYKSKLLSNIHDNDERQKLREFREDAAQLRRELYAITHKYFYAPAERILISTLAKSIFQIVDKEIKLPSFLTAFASEFEFAREAIIEKYLSPLSVVYKFENNKNIIRLANGQKIDLEKSATGFQSLIPLLLVLENRAILKNQIFIIEEPEINLYPNTQKDLIEYLIEKCTKGDNRLIITTHSPYILTALNNCIQAKNALRDHPEQTDEVAKLIRPESQIDYEDVMAYFVADGTAKPIMNDENRLINGNALDEISNDLTETFDRLLDLEMHTA